LFEDSPDEAAFWAAFRRSREQYGGFERCSEPVKAEVLRILDEAAQRQLDKLNVKASHDGINTTPSVS
jgi:hypothetical protein